MKAFKCDRCHRYFDKYKFTNDMSFRGGTVEVSNGTPLDLCEDCRLALVRFMEDRPEEEIETCIFGCKCVLEYDIFATVSNKVSRIFYDLHSDENLTVLKSPYYDSTFKSIKFSIKDKNFRLEDCNGLMTLFQDCTEFKPMKFIVSRDRNLLIDEIITNFTNLITDIFKNDGYEIIKMDVMK